MDGHGGGTVAPWLDAAQWRFLGAAPAEEASRATAVRATLRALLDAIARVGTAVPDTDRDLADAFFGWRLELGAYGVDGVDRVDVSGRPRSGAPLVFRVHRGVGEEVRFVSHGWLLEVRPLLDALQTRLHGDELEVDYRLAASRRLLPPGPIVFPDGWWTGWKEREADGVSFGEGYRALVYPPLATALRPLGAACRVLELGGGDGEGLAQLDGWSAAVLVDRNADLLAQAAARFGDRVHTRRHDLREDVPLTAFGGPFDLVIAVGVLGINVLDRACALRWLGRIRDGLPPGGRCVITGWTPSLVVGEDLVAAGFEVHNRAAPASPAHPEWRHHLYLLRRG